MHPSGDRPGEPHNVGRKWCVILHMMGRVITDYIDDRRRRAARVVEIGEPVCQSWPQVQQRRGWLLRPAAVAIGHPGHRAFKKAEHGPHALDPVEGRYKMHFRRAGIAETHLNARSDKRTQKAFRAVHVSSSVLQSVTSMLFIQPLLACLRQTKALNPVMDLPTSGGEYSILRVWGARRLMIAPLRGACILNGCVESK